MRDASPLDRTRGLGQYLGVADTPIAMDTGQLWFSSRIGNGFRLGPRQVDRVVFRTQVRDMAHRVSTAFRSLHCVAHLYFLLWISPRFLFVPRGFGVPSAIYCKRDVTH